MTLIATILFLITVSFSANAAGWEVTSFKVYQGWPVDAPDWREQEEGEEDEILDSVIVREIENFLFATAKLYSELGFPDPSAGGAYDSILEDENGEKYIRVYAYEKDVSYGGWYSSGKPCAEPATNRRIININALKYKDSGSGISDANYQTLAHEMVHAIQKVSAFVSPGICGLTPWFSEGTADALGYYAARRLRNVQFRKELASNEFIKVFGARPYTYPLNTPPAEVDTAYATSSFWRFLAEMAAASAHGKNHSGSVSAQENWTYLAQFYKSPYPYRPGPIGEVTWVNQLMKANSLIHADMATVFALFVTSFGDIINTRIGPLGLVPDVSEREPRWLKRLFGSCPFIGAVGDQQSRTYSHYVKPNTAGCFYTKVSPGARGKTLQISVSGHNKKLLKQLRIGMLDGSFTSAPSVSGFEGLTDYFIASWTFPVLKNVSMTFIFSNMASQPAITEGFLPEFYLSVGDFQKTLGGDNQGPVQPAGQSGTGALSPSSTPQPTAQAGAAKPTRREIFEQQNDETMADPASNLGPITKVERNSYDRLSACSTDKRRFNRCDARLSVTMELSPITRMVNGFSLDQMGIDSMGLDLVNDITDGTMARSVRLSRDKTESMDGSKITIRMPAIEYGFTGAIDNALIRVSKANSVHKAYVSYGPTQQAGGRRVHQPANGKVIIEEYQPMVLRGRFSADLVDESNPGSDDAPIVARSVQGQFTVSAPWEGDADFELDEDFVKEALAQKMLLFTPFGVSAATDVVNAMGAPPLELCDSDYSEDQIMAMGFLVGCGSTVASDSSGGVLQVEDKCGCSCESMPIESSQPACVTQCSASWTQCKTIPEIPEGIAGQDALYRQLLEDRNTPEVHLKNMVNMFSRAPEYQRKGMLKQLLDDLNE